MARRRFYFLEPSKVGNQHSTLIEGYLIAISASPSIRGNFELVLCASRSILGTLPQALTTQFRCRPIPVMNPEKKRQTLKTFVELFVVLRWLVTLRRGDVLFISCLFPTTLLLLEFVNRLFRRTGVYVALHGEVEGLFAKSPQRFRAFGYWAATWMRSRRSDSLIRLVVLDDFIRDELVQVYASKLNSGDVHVIHHPGLPMPVELADDRRGPAVCFIGYRTRLKGFDDFSRMASAHSSIEHLAIGGGKVENISAGTVEYLTDRSAYFEAIAKCSLAVFPCSSGYSYTLSASALDALAAGVPIVALDQPFFRHLASYFGSDMVTVRSSVSELTMDLDRCLHLFGKDSRAFRLQRLAASKYGLSAVQKSFEKLLLNSE